VLAGFLLYVGIEHASLVSDLKTRDEFLVASAVAAISVATSNISAGVVVGLAVHGLLGLLGRRHARALSAMSHAADT